MNINQSLPRIITVTVSGTLFDRVADSLYSDLGQRFGRGGEWSYRRKGKGSQMTIMANSEEAEYIAGYFETLAGMSGIGMDPEGARDTRIEGKAAGRSAIAIRRQLA